MKRISRNRSDFLGCFSLLFSLFLFLPAQQCEKESLLVTRTCPMSRRYDASSTFYHNSLEQFVILSIDTILADLSILGSSDMYAKNQCTVQVNFRSPFRSSLPSFVFVVILSLITSTTSLFIVILVFCAHFYFFVWIHFPGIARILR